MEIDLILLVPSENKICIIISEVKRIEELKNFNPVQNALIQLSKDVKFVLSLLPDIPAENIIIKTFAVFPETKTNQIFCSQCAEHILSREDFEFGLESFKKKLCLETPKLTKENEGLLLNACARLIGHEQIELFEPINKYIISFENTVDTLLFLDEDQQSLLSTLDEDLPKIKHFALKGPSGSGKTIISIKIANKLIDRYLCKKVEKVFIYAGAMKQVEKGMKLTKYFENNIIQQDTEKVVCFFKKFSEIKSDIFGSNKGGISGF